MKVTPNLVAGLALGSATDGYPTWSPDGTKILFVSTLRDNGELWVVRDDGTGLRRVTTNDGNDHYARWILPER